MIQHFNTSELIDGSETHYRFHSILDESEFPQVHDFYEISLITAGKIEVTAGKDVFTFGEGVLHLICPGIVHAKRNLGGCQFINLAFPRKTVTDLFSYLGQEREYDWLQSVKSLLYVHLTPSEANQLREEMQSLSMLPHNQQRITRAALRRLLLNCMASWFIPMAHDIEQTNSPSWMRDLLSEIKEPANLAGGMDYMLKKSGVSIEHLCRSFQKYMGISPHAFLNEQRLNYAANLLRHSDHSVLDIAFEAGFQSASTFYHNFTKRYGIPPSKYRNEES